MSISVNGFLSLLGDEYEALDFTKIQGVVDSVGQADAEQARRGDFNTFMLDRMRSAGLETPSGLHFHYRADGVLYPPEPEDCEPPPTCLVIGTSPGASMEVEHLRRSSTGVARAKDDDCVSCFICIIWIHS